jgi:hypothetical protein
MDLSTKDLQEALSIRRQIDALQKRLSGLFGGRSGGAPSSGRRRLSAAARAKIAAAARARWARVKRGGGAKVVAKHAPKKRRLTAAGRKKLSDLMKARWAARRRAQKK